MRAASQSVIDAMAGNPVSPQMPPESAGITIRDIVDNMAGMLRWTAGQLARQRSEPERMSLQERMRRARAQQVQPPKPRRRTNDLER